MPRRGGFGAFGSWGWWCGGGASFMDVRFVRGGSRVEHRLFGTAPLVVFASTGSLPLWGVVWNVGLVGGSVSGTLLGPEGSGASFSSSVGLLLLSVPSLVSPLVGGVGVGGRVWWGSARILRTTQWTRASL